MVCDTALWTANPSRDRDLPSPLWQRGEGATAPWRIQTPSLPLPNPAGSWKGRAGWVHTGRGVGGVREKGMMSGGGWMDGNGGRVTWAGGQMDLFRDGEMYMDERGW